MGIQSTEYLFFDILLQIIKEVYIYIHIHNYMHTHMLDIVISSTR